MFKKIFLLFCLIYSSGCVTTGVFREASFQAPHAIILFQGLKGIGGAIGGHAVFPLEINGKEPSQLKWSHKKFRVDPGPITILAEANCLNTRVTAYDTIKFNIEAGEIYLIEREINIDNVVFTVKNSKNGIIYKNVVSKQPDSQRNSYYTPIIIPSAQ